MGEHFFSDTLLQHPLQSCRMDECRITRLRHRQRAVADICIDPLLEWLRNNSALTILKISTCTKALHLLLQHDVLALKKCIITKTEFKVPETDTNVILDLSNLLSVRLDQKTLNGSPFITIYYHLKCMDEGDCFELIANPMGMDNGGILNLDFGDLSYDCFEVGDLIEFEVFQIIVDLKQTRFNLS